MNCFSLNWNQDAQRFECPDDCGTATFVLFFGDRGVISSPTVYASLKNRFPEAEILGCSTGTVVEGTVLSDVRPTAVAVRLNHSRVSVTRVPLVGMDSFEAGRRLADGLKSPDLAGVLLLSDGLAVNGGTLVEGMQSILGTEVVIGGGLAGDGPDFIQTLVAANGPPLEGQVAALGFYGQSLAVKMGVGHGWDYFGPNRRVSRSHQTTLFELDGKPALDLYKQYLGEEAEDLPASALLYPLFISNPNDPSDAVIRTVLSVDHEANSMTFAGDIPEGWSARLMRGAFDHLIEGAALAGRVAQPHPDDGQSGLAVLVSCVGRRLLLDQRTEDEVEAVAASLPANFHKTGFYSYGEIASQGAGRCSLHNETMTIFTLEEAA